MHRQNRLAHSVILSVLSQRNSRRLDIEGFSERGRVRGERLRQFVLRSLQEGPEK